MPRVRLRDNKQQGMTRRTKNNKPKMNKAQKLEAKLRRDADRERTAKDLASKKK